MHINREDFFEEDDAEKRFDNSNYEVDQTFPKDGNRKVSGMMKGEMGGVNFLN